MRSVVSRTGRRLVVVVVVVVTSARTMRALAVIVALTLVASSAASSAGTVIELTDANFDEQVRVGRRPRALQIQRPPLAVK